MARQSYLTADVNFAIAEAFSEHRGEKANNIREAVADKLKEKKIDRPLPALSTIQREVKRLTEKNKQITAAGLDAPWCIGACIEYNIPGYIIPLLVENHQILKGRGPQQEDDSALLTIRRARWMAQLYPALWQSLEKRFPDDSRRRLRILSLIARAYEWREYVSLLIGKHYPDTTDLDTVYLVNEDFSDEALNAPLTDKFYQTARLSGLAVQAMNKLEAKRNERTKAKGSRPPNAAVGE